MTADNELRAKIEALRVMDDGSDTATGWNCAIERALSLIPAEAPSPADRTSPVAALVEALDACLEWIDAVPSETPLPAMPGFDRDWINSVRDRAGLARQQGRQSHITPKTERLKTPAREDLT